MKKIIIAICCIVVLLFAVYFFGSGLMLQSNAYIYDYELSEDGSEMTIDVGVSTSIGYIRTVRVHQQESGKLYLNFYQAFGGINGSVGAKNSFTIALDEDTEVIGICRANNCYDVVLEKNEDGVWEFVKQN